MIKSTADPTSSQLSTLKPVVDTYFFFKLQEFGDLKKRLSGPLFFFSRQSLLKIDKDEKKPQKLLVSKYLSHV